MGAGYPTLPYISKISNLYIGHIVLSVEPKTRAKSVGYFVFSRTNYGLNKLKKHGSFAKHIIILHVFFGTTESTICPIYEL